MLKREKINDKEQNSIQVMMIIFESTHLDWQRFWSQLETDRLEMAQSEISQVTKFN